MSKVELLAGEKQPHESLRAMQACNDYLRMGPGRSLAGLRRRYLEMPQNTAPTRSSTTLSKWSQAYGWPQRAETYDAKLEEEKNARAREIMETGLAAAHERVLTLKHLAAFLESQLYMQGPNNEYKNVWLKHVKQIGYGDTAERVDLERFNAALIDQFRGVLDDLAKETGGRVRKGELDVTSKGKELLPVDQLIAALRQAMDDDGRGQADAD